MKATIFCPRCNEVIAVDDKECSHCHIPFMWVSVTMPIPRLQNGECCDIKIHVEKEVKPMDEGSMNIEEESKFKALRHRFYRLAHHGPALLIEMGALKKEVGGIRFSNDEIREVLFEVAKQGRVGELEERIDRKEKEILAQIGHQGDPCIYCGLAHDEVKPGPCPVRKGMVKL